MKKKIIGVAGLVLVLALALTLGYMTYKKNDNVLLLTNLEALANSEPGNNWAPGEGPGTVGGSACITVQNTSTSYHSGCQIAGRPAKQTDRVYYYCYIAQGMQSCWHGYIEYNYDCFEVLKEAPSSSGATISC